MDNDQLSQFKIYGVGRVAANKKRGSGIIEVADVEKLPNLSGAITDHVETSTAKVESGDTEDAFEVDVKSSASVPAEWLPWGQTNRITAPDVRRGEYVLLFQFGDTTVLYWIELKAENILRRLETVTWIFSNERKEDIKLTENNTYSVTVSTHDKHITITTTKSDGEKYAYTIQLNTKDGQFFVKDDVGNYIFMDSEQNRIRAENRDKTFVDLDKRKLRGEALDSIYFKSKDITFEASNSFKIKTSTYSATASGNYSIKAGDYDNSASNFKFTGFFDLAGSGTVSGNWHESSSSGPSNNR